MTDPIQFDIKDDIGFMTFDLPGEKVNKLTSEVMAFLNQLLDKIAQERSIKALVIQSNKKHIFIAGADIREIEAITTAEEAFQKVHEGQSVLNKLTSLSIPTVAAIHGACLGGGAELVLACDYRVASDDPKTQIGLPEVNLGIIPGFGGTQRMPRLIGLQRSLPLILAGKAVDGQKAAKLKLVDACYPNAFFQDKVLAFVHSILTSKGKMAVLKRRRLKGLRHFILEKTFIGRRLVYAQAKKSLLEKTKGHYPAPLVALDVVKHGLGISLSKGLDYECRRFSELVGTPICKHLIQLFYTQEELKKETGVSDKELQILSLNKVAVLGAGLMGAGIAGVAALRGCDTRLKDVNWNAVCSGYKAIHHVYQQRFKRKRLSACDFTMTLNRLSSTTSYDGFQYRDIVVEAIVENMDIKKKVFSELEKHVSDDTIMASNTSSLSISEMATVLTKPDRFIGVHFFSPVDRMPLVEVVPGEATSAETIASVVAWIKRLKKTPVVVKNCAGFLVNRVLLPYANEAVLCLQDGLSIEEIDHIAVQFGMPLGPLSLMDEVGLDVGYKVVEELEAAYGERMAVAPTLKTLLTDKKWLGKKSKKGFYDYNQKKKVPNQELISLISTTHGPNNKSDIKHDAMDRMILVMINEAARCLDEQVVKNAAYLDMAMIMGTGFPPFRGGLCRYADQRGLTDVVERLYDFEGCYGKRFEPAPLLVEMATSKKQFYERG